MRPREVIQYYMPTIKCCSGTMHCVILIQRNKPSALFFGVGKGLVYALFLSRLDEFEKREVYSL